VRGDVKRIEDIIADPCPEHRYAPRPCVVCRGLELALRDRSAGRGWRDRQWLEVLKKNKKSGRFGLIPAEFDRMVG